MCVASRELASLRSRYDSCASSAFSSASSTRSIHSASPQRCRHSATAGRYQTSSTNASPFEYDIAATSNESVARLSGTSAPRFGGIRSLGNSVASDGEASSCRFSWRGNMSRFLAAQRHESVDSGLTVDSGTNQSDVRRASDPLLNNCGVSDTAPISQRCHSSASAPGTAAVWHGRRVGVGAGRAASLMSSHSSIATNMSDDVDVKFSPPTSEPSVVDQVVGDLIIPDEMRDFINETYGSQASTAAVSHNPDSTVADSPAAPVDSTSGLDEPAGKPAETQPSGLTSCMYEGQTQPRGSFTQPRQLARPVGDVRGAIAVPPAPGASPRSFDVPATHSAASYFRSPTVPQTYHDSHEVQVSQVSQSWRAESASDVRRYSSAYRPSSGPFEPAADDVDVRHRRNPHQRNWWTWTRTCGYQAGTSASYRPNYSLPLPLPSVHPPCTAASFVSSQVSPTCDQVDYLLTSLQCTVTAGVTIDVACKMSKRSH